MTNPQSTSSLPAGVRLALVSVGMTAFCLGRGQRWIRDANMVGRNTAEAVEPELGITWASAPRQETPAARMDAVKSTSGAVAHQVSF